MPLTDDDIVNLLQVRFSQVVAEVNDHYRADSRENPFITILPVTKSVSARVIKLFMAILRDCSLEPIFGENRPQTLWEKATQVPHARWHFIGHLQRNKIERTVPLVELFHSIDSARLLQALDDYALKNKQGVDVLLEFNCSREAAKGGFAPEEVEAVAELVRGLKQVRVLGLMTMAAYSDDPETTRPTFRECRQLRDKLQQLTGLPLPELSMGMSHDFGIAIEEGATIIRVGSTLFEGLENE